MLKWIFLGLLCLIVVYFVPFCVIPHFSAWRDWRRFFRAGSGPVSKFFQADFRPDSKYCAITFDDGPSPLFTPKILDILKAHSVKCTFFLLGKKCQKYPDLVRRIVLEGHEIGIHGWDHCHPWFQNPLTLRVKIRSTRKAIEEATPREKWPLEKSPREVAFFRPPWGFWTLWNRLLTREYTPILWSIPGKDWVRGATPKSVADNVLSHLKGTEIVLIHDGGRYSGVTVQALPQILKGLENLGYIAVPVGSLPDIQR